MQKPLPNCVWFCEIMQLLIMYWMQSCQRCAVAAAHIPTVLSFYEVTRCSQDEQYSWIRWIFIKLLWGQFAPTFHFYFLKTAGSFFFVSRRAVTHTSVPLPFLFIFCRNNYILLYTIQLFSLFRNMCPRPHSSPLLHPETVFQLMTYTATYHLRGQENSFHKWKAIIWMAYVGVTI